MLNIDMDAMAQSPVILITVFAMAVMLVFLGFLLGIGVERYLSGKTTTVAASMPVAIVVGATVKSIKDSANRKPASARLT